MPSRSKRFPNKLFHHRIDHHVAGAGVKGKHLAERRARRDRRQIRNAADILRDAIHASITMTIAVQKIVDERYQRRAFSPGRHIRRTKIRNHRNSQPRRDHRAFSRLPRGRQLSSQKSFRHSLVIKRLPMTADQIKLHAMLARCLSHGLSVQFAEKKVQPSQIRNPSQFRIHHPQNRASNRSRKADTPREQEA